MALNYKNWRMRMKHPIRFILELAIPGLVFWLFIYIRGTMPDKDAKENQILAGKPLTKVERSSSTPPLRNYN
jgi:hypothetical protein